MKRIVVGSPGAVDTDFFRPGQKCGEQPAHVAYNDNLAHLRDIDKQLAEEYKQRFADVHAADVRHHEEGQGGARRRSTTCAAATVSTPVLTANCSWRTRS